MTDRKPVCLVIGAGSGIGGSVGVHFAANGYHSVLARRTNEEGLAKLVAEAEAKGGEATGVLANLVEDGAIEDLVERVEADIGPIETVVYNLGAQIGDVSLLDTRHRTFELGWRMATYGLFRIAKAVIPHMLERPMPDVSTDGKARGNFLVTTATAAVRGNNGQHSHGAAMGGRRMLCQSLNAEFAPQGIHVCNILIDGPVESPDTLGKVLLGDEGYQKLLDEKGRGRDRLIVPTKLAETYFHIATQHRSSWSHEVDLRPFDNKPWWNG